VRLIVVLLAVVLGGSVLAGVFWAGMRSLDEPLHLLAPVRFKVASGRSFAHVAAELAAQGVVERPRAWVLYARWKGLASAVKAGEYEIEPGTTPRSLLAKMVSGQVLLHSFTIIDGWRVSELLAALRRSPDIASTLPARPADLMQKIGAPEIDSEGQFLPETYRFPAGTTDVELLHQAHLALIRELDAAWTDRDPNLPLQNAQELLIMASIVEKETSLPQELGIVAGLYLHRLSMGMRLQADPTVIYGLGDRYEGELRSVDLRTDTPYNTYTRTGLPPTPIALPSAAAIRAAAHPDKTDAIFFVASPKGDGSHVFSSTLAKQNAAVAQYVARQRQKSAASSEK
jgi:UPF0755 protein